jgi:hypothetical protein
MGQSLKISRFILNDTAHFAVFFLIASLAIFAPATLLAAPAATQDKAPAATSAAEEAPLKVFSEKERQRYLKTNPSPPDFEAIAVPAAPAAPIAPRWFSGAIADEHGSPLAGVSVTELSSQSPAEVSDTTGIFIFSRELPSSPLFMASQNGKLPSYFSPTEDSPTLARITMYEQHSRQPAPQALTVEADMFR